MEWEEDCWWVKHVERDVLKGRWHILGYFRSAVERKAVVRCWVRLRVEAERAGSRKDMDSGVDWRAVSAY
jgi:hypothetical protein